MTRDAEIDAMVALIRKAWLACPDLRLGQLIVAAVGAESPVPAIFYARDSTINAGLARLKGMGQ